MELIWRILFSQLILFFMGIAMMIPGTPGANLLEKIFGDYCRGLNIINGTQCALIGITTIVALWVL